MTRTHGDLLAAEWNPAAVEADPGSPRALDRREAAAILLSLVGSAPPRAQLAPMLDLAPAPLPDAQLDRVFSAIAFDWDGTAVPDRTSDTSALGAAMDRLLRAGARLAVLTGTRFSHVDGALIGHIRGPHVQRLLVATNRGSELYGYDASGEPILLARRVATPAENAALDAAADAAAQELRQATGLDVRVIRDRLNRRKIDLFPGWTDPPKSALAELVAAVDARLAGAGWRGGVAEVVRRTVEAGRAAGLDTPRVSSDGKHVEIGLTDKADAIDALMAWIGEPSEGLLLVGDEVGTVGGVPGSDARMRTPRTRDAAFASVGPEPGELPAGVIHLGGGPERFVALLHAQADRRAHVGADVSASPPPPVWPTPDPTQRVVEEGFDLVREHEIESCFTVGNGAAGVRGSLSEGTHISRPETRLAGVWRRLPSAGLPTLVCSPEWTSLRVRAGGGADFTVAEGAPGHHRTLDLAQGVLWRRWRHVDDEGRHTVLHFARFASAADRRLLVERAEITTENWSGLLELETRVGRSDGWRSVAPGRWETTPEVHGEASAALAASLCGEGRVPPLDAPGGTPPEGADEAGRWQVLTRPGAVWRLDRVLAIRGVADEALATGVDRLVAAHVEAWRPRFEAATVRVEGDAPLARAFAFAAHHLVAAADPTNPDVSIGARALTGPAYLGHVFWDTELWLLPVYTLTWPRAARALVDYRFRTLPAARERAAAGGWRGALYAWESAATGEDVTPPAVTLPDGRMLPVRAGELEHHVSAAVAWAAWHYWDWTGDDVWLRDAGAEVILETARFWASRGRFEDDGRFHVRGVIGPDEYHDDVDDNAYTNGMAAWNLRRGAEVARLVSARWPATWARLSATLALEPDEPDAWERAAGAMVDGLDAATGLIEQFEGFFGLEDIDLRALEPRSAPVDLLLGPERTRGAQVIKQADVLMLLALLPDRFPPEVHAANHRYYAPRTAHGSSLSPSIHAWVAARQGDLAAAEEYLRVTAAIDLDDHFGNAAGGVHIGALGGLWQAATFGFAGLRIGRDGPSLDPRLPPAITRMTFPLVWRERRFRAEIGPEGARLVPVTP